MQFDQLQDIFNNLSKIELLLLTLILLFLFGIVLFVMLIGFSRFQKNRKNEIERRNAKHIEDTLFAIAFDNQTLEELKQKKDFKKKWRKKLYRQQFLAELIKLHRLYGGEIALKLQQFYRFSGLLHLSYEKIRSQKWYLKCDGIQELSEMEIKRAAPIIRKYTTSENDTLKMVAIIEFLHLFGLEGITLLKDYDQPLNDWIQLNLLESIKEKQIEHVPDFGYLLESQNPSVIVFGLRLITLFQQHKYLKQVQDLEAHSSRKIRLQAQRSLKSFGY